MGKSYFITGIGTEVGKTLAAAIVTQSLKADYWKPVQAGDLENSDTHKLKKLVANSDTEFHPNSYKLKTPMSPHAAADIDGVMIDLKKIRRPETKRDLVIEGAGGLLVPLNEKDCIIDLIKKDDVVILVSRHYLGSINHTLLSLESLKKRGIEKIGVIFSGKKHPTTEDIIKKMSKVKVIGRIGEEPYFDEMVVKEYAEKFREELTKL